MARTFDDHLSTASEAFEAGFPSKAAQKRALDALNRAFKRVSDEHAEEYRAAAPHNDTHGGWDPPHTPEGRGKAPRASPAAETSHHP